MANIVQALTLRASAAVSTAKTDTGAIQGYNAPAKEALVVLNVTSAATLVGDTLDVYVDVTPDGGTTWLNVGHFTQVLGNGGAKKYVMALNSANAGTSAITDVTSDAAAGATRQYGIGTGMRYRGITVGTGAFTYSVTGYIKQ